jgi:hypothetical protein
MAESLLNGDRRISMRIHLIPLALLQMLPAASKTQEVVMQVDADHLVNYVVTDPAGRMTGIDPRSAARRENWKRFQEIPQSNYGFMSVGDLDPNASVEVSAEFVCHFASPESDGTYTFEFFGNKLGKFNLYVTAGGYDTTHIQNVRFDLKNIPIDKDSVITYRFSYHGRPGSDVSFVKVVSANSLLQDVSAMHKLGWIRDQSTADKYLGYFSTAKTQLEQNNTAGARTTLQSVLHDVDVDSSSTLTSEAYALLRYNTEYLLNQLPVPQELSVDDLIALEHQAEARGWIGDGNFVKEPDNDLDNAKKHLVRGDSVNCAKELGKFQEKVKNEYEKTLEDQKKHKPRGKRFVTEEGYRSLTEGAQEIIDRLPKKE